MSVDRFIRMPQPLHSRLPADPDRLSRALLYGLHIARPAQAFGIVPQLYGRFAVRKCRLSPGPAWAEIEDAAAAFSIPLQQVVAASLHFALHDGFSPFHDPSLREELAQHSALEPAE